MLDSGTTRSLNLFRQFPGFAVTFNAQGTCHHQRILLGRCLKTTLVPEGARAVLLEGLPVKTCEVWLYRFRVHNTHTTTTPYKISTLLLEGQPPISCPAQQCGSSISSKRPHAHASYSGDHRR